MAQSTPDYLPIEDYGIIGDMHTTALVNPGGSIDFMCFPAFDSPSIFCAVLDRQKGGCFSLEPILPDARMRQMYIPDTNVLLSRFHSAAGIAEISNFMVVDGPQTESQALVRRIKAARGDIKVRMRFAPRFDYARAAHTATFRNEKRQSVLFQSKGGDDAIALWLHAGVPMELSDGDATAEFSIPQGEHVTFVMELARENAEPVNLTPEYSTESFKQTTNFWRRWIGRCTYHGRWRESVHRSALALKLLICRKHGSIIAAPTFGFPAEIGGERNWDYRYTWLRDGAFSIYALMRLGYTEEAAAFNQWLGQRIEELEPGEELQVMYRIDGRKLGGEFHLDHLSGYRGSRPVRIGSTNHDQRQLDIYGALLDSIYLYDKYGSPISHTLWGGIRSLIDHVCEHWRKPDSGIWEVRSGQHEFLYSRLMCWVAVDRALRLATKRSLPAPHDRWRATRDEIFTSIHEEFWNPQRRAFVQTRGSNALDASTLLMPLVRMISATDPKWVSTLRAIEEDLVEDRRVYRYRVNDDFPEGIAGRDGTFSICSFWYAECVARTGDLQKARLLFEMMLESAGPLGLFSEQMGPAGEFLGNMPQAYTHLGLISAAFDIDRRLAAIADKAVSGGSG
jgi:GH15 family glucan-1,4-alpha-glucosidase